MPEPTYRLLFDVEKKRPACVLLQALAGNGHPKVFDLFSSETWLVGMEPGFRQITATRAQWEQIAEQVNPQPRRKP